MTDRSRLPFALSFAAAFVVTFAFLAAAHADTGGLPDPSDTGEWWSGRVASLVIAVTFCALFVLDKLAGTRWRWTRWLRVGKRRAGISASLGVVLGVLPAAFSGELTSRAGWEAAVLIGGLLAKPGNGEPKPEAAGEIDDGGAAT